MTQDEIERLIREGAPEYHAPPEPPRDAMWAAIRSSLPRHEPGRQVGGPPLAAAPRWAGRSGLGRWAPWAIGLAAAAVLAVGFGLGRVSRDRAAQPADRAVATPSADAPSLPVRLAAASHMGEAEALLTMFRSSDRSEDRLATARWARDLLGTTRLLLDSRAGSDPELARLLSDLEVVLVQIASTDAGDATEQQLIEHGIEQRQLMVKLRAAAEEPARMAM